MIARVHGCGVATGKVVVAQEKGWLVRLCCYGVIRKSPFLHSCGRSTAWHKHRHDETLRTLMQCLPYVPVMKLALVGEQNLKT